MTPKEFAVMCKDNLRLREVFNMSGSTVTFFLEVFDGEKWEDLDGSIQIAIKDGD